MDTRAKYQQQALIAKFPSNWAGWSIQNYTLKFILQQVDVIYSKGFRPIIEMDLDLTTLLATIRTQSILQNLASTVDELRLSFDSQLSNKDVDKIINFVKSAWEAPANCDLLLPSYTDSGIEAYSIYLATFIDKNIVSLNTDQYTVLSTWIQKTVYSLLRSGYWDRDLRYDVIMPGLEVFLSKVVLAGGEVVFISNRSSNMREHSIQIINKLIDRINSILSENTKRISLFAYFGPGGSKYDAVAKVKAQAHIELNTEAGIYFSELRENEVIYSEPHSVSESDSVIVAVFDDRKESRDLMIDNAIRSNVILKNFGYDRVSSVAIATIGYAPEMSVVDSTLRIGSYEHLY